MGLGVVGQGIVGQGAVRQGVVRQGVVGQGIVRQSYHARQPSLARAPFPGENRPTRADLPARTPPRTEGHPTPVAILAGERYGEREVVPR